MEIISAKYLLTMDGDPVVDGAIAVEGGEIIDVGLEQQLLARFPNALHEDHPNHVLMPGLINAHTHLDMTFHKNFPFDPVRSLGVEVNYVDWLLSCIDYKKRTAPERLREAVEEGLSNCIESGTTCVADMGSYDGIFQSLAQTGIRAVIFPEVLSYDSYVAKDLFETALAIVEKYMDYDSERIGVGMGPYSPYTLSRNILRILSQYCKGANLPIMMHAAESFSEMEFFYNSTGDIASRLFPNIGWGDNLPPAHHKTPIEYLDGIEFLAAGPILAGCVHATEADIERLATRGAKVAWCPRSSDYLKLGRANIVAMHQKNIPIALGTDGISSVNTLSLWDEMRFAFEIAGNKGLTGRDILAMTTSNAAQILGLADEIGTLAIGKKSDYLVLDAKSLPEDGDLFSNLIQHTKNYHVQKVVVGGDVLKRVN